MRPEDIINLDDYPIADADAPERAALAARLKQRLDEDTFVTLPGFFRPAALERAVEDAMAARPNAFHNKSRRNCYLHRRGDESQPADHPRNILMDASTRMIAYDLIPPESPVKLMYHWPPMRDFVAAIVGAEALYESEDPLQPVNLLCYEDGDQSAWHFDSVNAFTMTLMLQAPEGGGEFQIVPNSRTDDDQNYGYVGRVVRGECPEAAVSVAREPGALCLFRGCNSLHRVAPVRGERMRIMGVFVYETAPGIVGEPEVNATVYGR